MAKEIKVALVLDTRDFDRGISRAKKSVSEFTSSSSKEFDTLKASVAGIFGAIATDQIIKYADSYTNLQNKLRSVFESQTQAAEAFSNIKSIATETRSSIKDVGDLYTKLSIATKEAGVSQTEVAQMTETFTKALKLSGAESAQASSAILQFGQAMASGKLQGDEFRSLMENSPVFMRKLSDALGVSIGKMRDLSKDGMLTAEVIRAGMTAIAPEVENEFGRTVSTVGDSFTYLKDQVMLMIGRVQESTGVFTTLSEIIRGFANNLDLVAYGIAAAFGVATARLVFNFVKAMQALNLVTKIQAGLQAAVLAFSGPAGWAALAAGALAAGAAIMGINKILNDTVVKEEERAKATEEQRKQTEAAQQAARDLLERTIKQKEAEKAAEKAAKEAAREAKRRAEEIRRGKERDIKNTKEILDGMRSEIELSRQRYQNELNAIGLSDTQKKTQNEQFELQKKYNEDIVKLQNMQYLTEEQKADAIGQVTKMYLDEKAAIDERNRELFKAQAAFNLKGTLSNIAAEQTAFKQSIQDQQSLRLMFNDAERAAAAERLQIERDFYLQAEQLKSRYKDASDEELRILLQNLEIEKQARLKASEERGKILIADAESQRSFAYGWEQAFGQFAENLTNQAAYAKNIFDTMTQGFTNAIVNFVMTGKLSFKDLFRSLLVEIVKMQANKLFLSIFGKGGPLSSLFAGFFANGGDIPVGKWGIAGEAGPELVKGPATITSTRDTAAILGGANPYGSPTMVTYNIQAVDARSFKELVAQDPEFIYSVTRAGARRIPR
jgi:tape measure domain-containing protein